MTNKDLWVPTADPTTISEHIDFPNRGTNGAEGRHECINETPSPPEDVAASIKAWPIMKSPAMHGIVGEITRLAITDSEADPVSIMSGTIATAAAHFGRGQFTRIGDTATHSRHFNVVVGNSSRGRKGTADAQVHRFFERAEAIMMQASSKPFPGGALQISYGPLSSGEGLIFAVRDGDDKEDGDPGVIDKRLLVLEQELGAALRALQRNGNILSPIIRRAFDGGTLAPLTKRDRIVATNPHICISAAITMRELDELLTVNDIWNGFGNRFQWFVVRRAKIVPFPKPMPNDKVDEIARKLARVITLAHKRGAKTGGNEIVMSNSAQDHWGHIYPELTQDHPGILGAVTSRQETHAWRLALTYAQLDGAARIEISHLEAALAFNRYAFDSAAYLFGGAELDPIAQTILEGLERGPKTQSEIRDLFGRHQTAARLNQVLSGLQERGRITLTEEKTPGRTRKIWTLAA